MNRKAFIIAFFISVFIVQLNMGQRPVNKTDIRDKVVLLLNDYQHKLSAIKSNTESDPVREVTALFSNPRVKVVNNLSDQPLMPELGIRDYCVEIRETYLDGVKLSINPAGIRLGSIEAEHGEQYFVKVNLTATIRAFPGGVVYENKQQLEMKVTFQWDGESASTFRIANIAIPQYNKQDLGAGINTGGLRFTAPWLENETRASQSFNPSYGIYLKYRYWLKPGFGIGTGFGWNNYMSQFHLDRLNPLSGKDPNISNVDMYASFLSLSVPAYVALKSNLSEKIDWYAEIGIRASFRYWGTFSTEAVQTNLGNSIRSVISYPEWESDLTRIELFSTLETGIEYLLMKNLKFSAAMQLYVGINPIDNGSDLSFETSKYAGQYNPLWMSPESRSYLQYAGIQFGLSYTLEQKK